MTETLAPEQILLLFKPFAVRCAHIQIAAQEAVDLTAAGTLFCSSPWGQELKPASLADFCKLFPEDLTALLFHFCSALCGKPHLYI